MFSEAAVIVRLVFEAGFGEPAASLAAATSYDIECYCYFLKTTAGTVKTYTRSSITRPGIHAKTKSSKLKKSKNYKKAYRSQGR